MRIISGTHKGRPIRPPGNLPVRPTTDFAKESLFNILNNKIDFEGLAILDLFAGTGSISYEFASRGASMITSVDINFHATEFIRKTSAAFGFGQIKVIKASAFAFIGFCKVQYDIIFADPPFDMTDISEIPDLVMNNKLLKEEGLLIIEHSHEFNFTKHPAFKEHRNYGKVNFSFFI